MADVANDVDGQVVVLRNGLSVPLGGGGSSSETLTVECGSDLLAAPGQIVVIMGASGIGKSSLALAAVSQTPGAGMVRQDATGLEHLDVRDNLRLVNGDDECIEQRVRDVRLGIPYRRNLLAGKLSGGERRRMTVLRGLLADCGVLWLDEPDAGLDSDTMACVGRALVDVSDRVLVVITHNARFAELLRPSQSWEVKQRGSVLHLSDRFQTVGAAGAPSDVSATHAARASKRVTRAGPVGTGESLRALGRRVSVRVVVAWKTFLRSLRLSLVNRSALVFACLAGVLMAIMTTVIFGSVSGGVGLLFVACEAGTQVARHAVPAITGVLYGSVAGATIVAWLGQMVARQELWSLSRFRASVGWAITGTTWLGLAIGSVGGVLLAVSSTGITLDVVLATSAFEADACIGRLRPSRVIIEEIITAGKGRWLLEVVLYASIVATTAITVATGNAVRSQHAVAAAIPRAIVWLTLLILVAKITTVRLQW